MNPDITARKHGGNPQSVAANPSLSSKALLRKDVLAVVAMRGDHGATADEASEILHRPVNALSGRFTELAAEGKLVRTGRTRPTRSGRQAGVWIVPQQWTGAA